MHFSQEKILLLLNDTLVCKRPVLIYLHARELFMFFFSSADFLQNKVFKNKPPRTTIRVPNSLDPDQDGHSVGLHLGSKCLQKAIGKRQNYPLACKELYQVNTLVFNILSPIGIYMHMYTINIRTL